MFSSNYGNLVGMGVAGGMYGLGGAALSGYGVGGSSMAGMGGGFGALAGYGVGAFAAGAAGLGGMSAGLGTFKSIYSRAGAKMLPTGASMAQLGGSAIKASFAMAGAYFGARLGANSSR